MGWLEPVRRWPLRHTGLAFCPAVECRGQLARNAGGDGDLHAQQYADQDTNDKFELYGRKVKIEAFEGMIRPHGLIEMVRTGEVAIQRAKSES